ncbi:hypothetical protein CANCADRAFT_31773 [Tortispora caseinolytica NRRL Y-17796]|uniref:Peroxisomal membrane protein 4 n=1 Tax=Tortispora caseinolytica NRRL Y-17796 TaxID=767744 RepID=A0A1E4TGX5_9ASCO|nr:hypothetical protein CANCADRAFT_31773 [Tortispora caseinolytica NRRL Y-17796]
MDSLIAKLDEFIADPKNHDILSVLKGARNGFVYGFKVRVTHSIVMALLFKKGSYKSRFRGVTKASLDHSTRLAKYVAMYKIASIALRKLQGKHSLSHTFVAGVLAGYLMFGRGNQSPVSQQVVLYVFSRAVMGMAKYSIRNGLIPSFNGKLSSYVYPAFAALSWAIVMVIYELDPASLQISLRNSMVYLYDDSEKFSNFSDLLLHN